MQLTTEEKIELGLKDQGSVNPAFTVSQVSSQFFSRTIWHQQNQSFKQAAVWGCTVSEEGHMQAFWNDFFLWVLLTEQDKVKYRAIYLQQ